MVFFKRLQNTAIRHYNPDCVPLTHNLLI